MGKGSEWVAANQARENTPGSCEAHDVSSSPQEDCSVSESAVGENKSAAEEGCLDRTSHLTLTDTNESPTVD
jgi:hypothetical protein